MRTRLTVVLVALVGGCSPPAVVTPPAASVPGAPTQVIAIAHSAQAEVSWLTPENDGGSAVTGYRITSNPEGVTLAATSTRAIVTGLTNGTRYTFTVTATNSVGTGPASAPSNEVRPATTPSAPTSIIAMAGNRSATVSWTSPLDAGGSELTGYSVRNTAGDVVATSSGATQVLVSSLVNGTSYAFTVIALNDAGSSAPSPFSNLVTPLAVPDVPTMVTAVAGNERANLSWLAPPESGGDAITRYTVTSDPEGLSAITSGATQATVLGLVNGTTYTFTVRAENSLGAGLPSQPSNAVTPATLPGTPLNVVAFAADEEVDVTWDAPFSDGGGPITSYTVTANPGGHTVISSSTRATLSGLINGTSYTFTVRATNWAGTGLPSSLSNAVTPLGVPDAPTSPTAVRGDHQATVSWAMPTDVGGTPITRYTVTSSPGGLTANTNGGTEVTVLGLTNGTSYKFTVSATNAVGTSAASAPSNLVIPSGLPSAPTAVTGMPGDREVMLSWTAAPDNGAPVTLYRVTSNPPGVSVSSTATAVTLTGLTNGVAYTFRVEAQNLVGTGPQSAPSDPVTPATLPGVATLLTATPGNLQATLYWTPAPANGSPITRYTVTSSPGGLTANTAGATNAVLNGLTNGTAYTFTVTATNVMGTGAASAPSAPIVPRDVPGAPTGVSAVGGTGEATVAWIAPVSDGGSPITGYLVTSFPSGVSITVGLATQVTITGIIWSGSHTFTVRAINAAGRGPPSAQSNVVALFSPACSGSLAMGGELPLVSTEDTPIALKLVDLDGDGKLDLVVAASTTSLLTTHRGVGNGTFGATVHSASLGGNGDRYLATGDLNGDGRPDVVGTNPNSSIISAVLFSQASGGLTTRVDSSWLSGVRSLSLGDFDGDAKLDLLAATSTDVTWMRGTGAGSFLSGPLLGNGRAVASGDFNGDGNLDAIILSGATVRTRLGNGDGTFRLGSTTTVVGTGLLVVPFQANADGRLDVAILTSVGSAVLLGGGDGTFAVGPTMTPSSVDTDTLAIADINADGFADLVQTNSAQAQVIVRRGDGSGAFSSPTFTRTGLAPRSVALGDVNGDGNADLCVVYPNADVVSVFVGAGDGSFLRAPEPLTTRNQPIFMTSGDFDGDGRRDLAVANYVASSLSIGLGLGDGSFSAPVVYTVGSEVSSVISVDLNADGKLDLVSTNRASNSLSLLMGLGNGSFQNTTLPTGTGTVPGAVAAADLNGDGRVDLAVANYGNSTLGIHLANGSGGFVTSSFPASGNPHSIVAADFNADGKLDLALGSYSSRSLGVFIGNGDGTFSPAVTYAVDANPYRIAAADFDNDGALDLAVAHMGATAINLLKGNGDGTFQPKRQLDTAGATPSVVARDMDLDGQLDLVVANNSTDSVSIYRGRGDATFFPPKSYLTGSSPYMAIVDDFNGDGSPDIATCNFNGGNVSMLLRTACLP